jgi:hypothetical protein
MFLLEGLCNASASVLGGCGFAFVDLRRVLGFMAATCLGATASAVGAAATITVFHTAASFWGSWRAWFISNGVEILVVAPLMIVFGQVRCNLPSQVERIEGGVSERPVQTDAHSCLCLRDRELNKTEILQRPTAETAENCFRAASEVNKQISV